MLGELENTWCNWETLLTRGHGGQPLSFAYRFRKIITPLLFHHRLGIKQIHLGRSTRLKKVDHPLRLGGKIGKGTY